MLEAVAVSWSAAERYATSAEVIWFRPVGQQRARDGRLRLCVLRACRAVVSQQGVHLRRGVVGQQRGRNGAVVSARPVVGQQRVHL